MYGVVLLLRKMIMVYGCADNRDFLKERKVEGKTYALINNKKIGREYERHKGISDKIFY